MTDQEKYEFYTDQLAGATLEVIARTEKVQSFLLRRYPNRYDFSACITFLPGAIAITGSLRIANNGVISLGYGMDWFTSALEPDYLAERFLQKQWDPDRARARWRWYLEQQKEADETEPAARRTWKISCKTLPDATQADAIAALLAIEEAFETSVDLYNSLPAYEDGGRFLCPYGSDDLGGYGYLESEIGWLHAIQSKFAELYPTLQLPPTLTDEEIDEAFEIARVCLNDPTAREIVGEKIDLSNGYLDGLAEKLEMILV